MRTEHHHKPALARALLDVERMFGPSHVSRHAMLIPDGQGGMVLTTLCGRTATKGHTRVSLPDRRNRVGTASIR